MKIGIPKMSRRKWIGFAVLAIATAFLVKIWNDTLGDPTVLRTKIELPGKFEPVTIALISDIHVAGPDMPPARLERIVSQINELKPDLVVIAGDMVSEKRSATHIYSAEEAVTPLGALSPPLGTVMVPGNHDHWFGWAELSDELRSKKITILANEATQIGPLAIGGLDDAYTQRDDLEATLNAMQALSGPKVLLSHSPDPFADLPNDILLMLAGHTHCGQIAYPWGGAPAYMSRYGDRYACGRIDEEGKSLVVGAGLGTSLVPVRLFTEPEIWMIELVPAQ